MRVWLLLLSLNSMCIQLFLQAIYVNINMLHVLHLDSLVIEIRTLKIEKGQKYKATK